MKIPLRYLNQSIKSRNIGFLPQVIGQAASSISSIGTSILAGKQAKIEANLQKKRFGAEAKKMEIDARHQKEMQSLAVREKEIEARRDAMIAQSQAKIKEQETKTKIIVLGILALIFVFWKKLEGK